MPVFIGPILNLAAPSVELCAPVQGKDLHQSTTVAATAVRSIVAAKKNVQTSELVAAPQALVSLKIDE